MGKIVNNGNREILFGDKLRNQYEYLGNNLEYICMTKLKIILLQVNIYDLLESIYENLGNILITKGIST
jgi:hypothetical protein